MPFKKGRKTKNKNTKEKKAIATRLMVISLKIDDYIYKHKPISVQDAQMYVEEIAQLKLKCANDERSLQVIEKLTLFLKCIVEESTSSNNHNENFNITQNIGTETISNENTSVSTVNVTTNISDKNNVKEGNLGGFNNTENNNQITSCINTQNNQMETLSNLSIDHSESIINNNTEMAKVIETNNAKAIQFDKESTFTAKRRNQNEQTQITGAECNINANDFNKNNAINNNIEQTFNYDKTSEQNKMNLTATTIHTCECSPKNVTDTNESTITINNKQNIIKGKTQTLNRKPRNKRTKNKEVKGNDTNKDKKNSNTKRITKKKFEVPMKNSNNVTKINSDTSKIANINVKSVENKTNKVVNKGSIDISWVENIKYVREVCKEEYETPANSLEETFWRDHTLPVDWNFNDFDYKD